MNPLNLNGPDFLVFYAIVLAAAIFAVVFVRQVLRRGNVTPTNNRWRDLDAFELAYLAGGPVRTVQAALVSLANREAIVAGPGNKLSVGQGNPGVTSVAETAVLRAVRRTPTTNFARVLLESRGLLRPLDDQLVGAGLLVPPATRTLAMLVGLVVMLAVLALGIAKIVVGVERHKPVGFLVFGCIITLVALCVLAAKQIRRTRAGDAAVKDWSRQSAVFRRSPSGLNDEQLMLGVALFGPSLLAGTTLADLQRPISFVSSGGGGGDGSSGSSCGGSSCGGGSCGGGGCGGCGGGGD